MLKGGEEGDTGILKFKMNDYDTVKQVSSDARSGYVSIEEWDAQMTALAGGNSETPAKGTIGDLTAKYVPKYADEILPFDITITIK